MFVHDLGVVCESMIWVLGSMVCSPRAGRPAGAYMDVIPGVFIYRILGTYLMCVSMICVRFVGP